MINHEEAMKMLENPTLEVVPTDKKRIIIPAFGYAGATPQLRDEWGADGPYKENVQGLPFQNPKDNATQILKQKDGVLICYDAPGRQDKINKYLNEHPDTFKNAIHLKHFISYMKDNVLNGNPNEKPDLWDSDTAWASGLLNAPSKEDIKVGQIFSSAKKNEAIQAIYVQPGTVYEGAEGHPQTADKGGAYLIKDSSGIRLIQSAEFKKAYSITKGQMPQERGKTLDR
jgi:hypothetical protein